MYDFGIFGDFDFDLTKLGFKGGIFFKDERKSIVPGHLIKVRDKFELKKSVKGKKGFILLKGGDYDLRRYAVEKCLVDGIIGMEKLKEGMDDVLAKRMAERKVSLVINLRDYTKARRREIILGRMMRHVFLAKKFKTPIMLVSGARKKGELKHPYVMISFGVMLGLSVKEAKEALRRAQEGIIKRFKNEANA